MWLFSRKGPSGFSATSTAEEVTEGIDGTGLTAIITGCEGRGYSIGKVVKSSPETVGKIMFGRPGASSGIGAESARVLALRGVHVIMAVRNTASGNTVKETILKDLSTAKVDVMDLDLCSMASIRKFASDFTSMGLPLNILVNNAGVMATPFMLSQDNIELQFATNHVGHFLLTNLLLETMKNTVYESKIEGRIVNVSSNAHLVPYRGGIRFDKINDKSGYNSIQAYGQSKLANILHATELNRRLKEEGVAIIANSVHPGAIVTNILRYHGFLNGIVNWTIKYLVKNIKQGAATICYVALHPQVKGLGGKYFVDSNLADPSSQAKDMELAKKLWDFSMTLTN